MQENRNRNKFISAVLILLFVLLFVTPVLADELQEKQQQLNSIQQQLESQQRKAELARRKEQSIAEQLRVIQRELDAAEDEYDNVNDQLENTEEQIKANAELSVRMTKKLEVQTNTLHRRIRDIYKNGQISYLDVLFGSKDFNDFVGRMDILKKILAYDKTLILTTRSDQETLRKTKAKLEITSLLIR